MKIKLKNILMISFLAVAGIFGVSSAVINNRSDNTLNAEKADAVQEPPWYLQKFKVNPESVSMPTNPGNNNEVYLNPFYLAEGETWKIRNDRGSWCGYWHLQSGGYGRNYFTGDSDDNNVTKTDGWYKVYFDTTKRSNAQSATYCVPADSVTVTYKKSLDGVEGAQISTGSTTNGITSYTASCSPTAQAGYTYTSGKYYTNVACTEEYVTGKLGSNLTLYVKYTSYTASYSVNGGGYIDLQKSNNNDFSISGFVKNYYTLGGIDQVSGQSVAIKVNGSVIDVSKISCISASDNSNTGRLNNLYIDGGVLKFRYSNINGYLNVVEYNDSGTLKYKVYAGGLLETSGANYSIIVNDSEFVYCGPDGTDYHGHTQYKVTDLLITETDRIKFINRTAEYGTGATGNPYVPSYVEEGSEDLLTLEGTGATVQSGMGGYYTIYILQEHDGDNVNIIAGVKTGFKVTFDKNNSASTDVNPKYVKNNGGSGEKISAPTAPTADGYTFGGWYKEAKCTNAWNFSTEYVTADTILYAKWTANNYTVTYANGGHGTAPSSAGATYGTTFTTAAAITGVTGYTFDHWHGNNGTDYNANTGFTYNIVGNLTLTAVWTNNVYTITLDNQSANTSGTGVIYEKYADGYYTDSSCTSSLSTIVKPTKNNCTFGGYYTAVGGGGTQIINASGSLTASATTTRFTDITTLYAKWTFTIAYNSNGGSGTTSSTTLTYGVAGSLSANAFSVPNDGYIFGTWNTNSSGSGTNYSSGANLNVSQVNTLANSSTRTLYAKWTSGEAAAISFAASFNSSIGKICESYNTNTKSSFLTKWNEVEEVAWDELEEYEQYWLLAVGRSSDDDIVEMIGNGLDIKGKYDYVLGKYGYGEGASNLHDFLGRTPTEGSASLHIGNIFGSEDNFSTIIIIISSSVALLSVTALSILVIRKRKAKED